MIMRTFWRSDLEMAARDGVIAYAFYAKFYFQSQNDNARCYFNFLS